MIDKYVEQIKDRKFDERGTSKLCWCFDDVVLLEAMGRISPGQVLIQEKLKSLGVNTYEILEQKKIGDKFYILETRVKGTPIQEYRCKTNDVTSISDIEYNYKIERKYIQNYLKRLETISSNKEQLKQFVESWFKIIDLGICIDPSKTTNFYYDNEIGYSFLDLDTNGIIFNNKMVFHYIFYVIRWCHSGCITEEEIKKENELLIRIVNMLKEICEELGLNINEYCLNFNDKPLEENVNNVLKYRFDFATKSFDEYFSNEIERYPDIKNEASIKH